MDCMGSSSLHLSSLCCTKLPGEIMKITVNFEDFEGDDSRSISYSKDCEEYLENVLYVFEDALRVCGYDIDLLTSEALVRNFETGKTETIKWSSKL